jgi:hypothetical protein
MQANFYVRKNAYSGLLKTCPHNLEKIYEKKVSSLQNFDQRYRSSHAEPLQGFVVIEKRTLL